MSFWPSIAHWLAPKLKEAAMSAEGEVVQASAAVEALIEKEAQAHVAAPTVDAIASEITGRLTSHKNFMAQISQMATQIKADQTTLADHQKAHDALVASLKANASALAAAQSQLAASVAATASAVQQASADAAISS